jgi:hypothetical protein
LDHGGFLQPLPHNDEGLQTEESAHGRPSCEERDAASSTASTWLAREELRAPWRVAARSLSTKGEAMGALFIWVTAWAVHWTKAWPWSAGLGVIS